MVYQDIEMSRIPGVYKVLFRPHYNTRGESHIGTIPFVAYWDGVDTWSYPWVYSNWKDAYSARMMKPGHKLMWTGKVL